MKSKLIGFLMNFWISFSLALYFHTGEREEKCIIEDIPSDTLVVGGYLSMLYDDLTHALTKITGNAVNWNFEKAEDTVMRTFFFLLQRIHLDIRVGEHFLDESAIQAKDKVNEVNIRLEHLIEQIHHVTREQHYERLGHNL
ncbi:Transmembrane emp24 domain-containing protein 11 [Lonchura striata]|uniref:Transmembrane emp24 domain-containing protein 11 n=1 Tax=Lonchura striata TaxID=40157 RepID=A0A218V8Q2_9PASE|nr:Transmembrane emp24 domain-containing protein 11 [Lonchura striata domestica]